MSQKVCHEHFSVVYTMKLLPNTYFMKCSERNISQCILAIRQISIQQMRVSRLKQFAGKQFFSQSPFEANEMFSLPNKFVLFISSH